MKFIERCNNGDGLRLTKPGLIIVVIAEILLILFLYVL